MKLEVSQHIFENYSNTKCDENPVGGRRIVPCGGKNRHDEANNPFSAILRTSLSTFIEFVQSAYLNLFAEKTMVSSTLVESPVILRLQ
jgi:hypothetical protein